MQNSNLKISQYSQIVYCGIMYIRQFVIVEI